MIHVLAIITTKPGLRETVLKELRAIIPAVHAENGCVEYGPAIDAERAGAVQTTLGPDVFVIVEKWDTVEALNAHLAAPHMAVYAEKTKDLVLSRVIHALAPC
ncbi:putative quinol monooxygenase [Microvirga massiliensis]|uniref:putative quinol monooxygenase n=1 Tax=Microvirga massiliensis TaxID=1033741 RepID=UPI00062B6006|nr:putative quinol monooxygenase [Microvirga massiliensis]